MMQSYPSGAFETGSGGSPALAAASCISATSLAWNGPPVRRCFISSRSRSPGMITSSKTFGGRAGMHALRQGIHALAIFIATDEQIGLHRHDEMADVLRLVLVLEMIAYVAAERRAGNDSAHHVHEHRQRRTFRAADRLHRAAIERDVRVGSLTALGVER